MNACKAQYGHNQLAGQKSPEISKNPMSRNEKVNAGDSDQKAGRVDKKRNRCFPKPVQNTDK